ncbi:MAG: hypothetical protein PWP65_2026 [Clostridia bacterium]|nr:hypothetical protein [Clostridia bacterium]
MALPRIMCSVNNCHYWNQGNVCNASNIMITSDKTGDVSPDSYDALQASTAQATPGWPPNYGDYATKDFAFINLRINALWNSSGAIYPRLPCLLFRL